MRAAPHTAGTQSLLPLVCAFMSSRENDLFWVRERTLAHQRVITKLTGEIVSSPQRRRALSRSSHFPPDMHHTCADSHRATRRAARPLDDANVFSLGLPELIADHLPPPAGDERFTSHSNFRCEVTACPRLAGLRIAPSLCRSFSSTPAHSAAAPRSSFSLFVSSAAPGLPNTHGPLPHPLSSPPLLSAADSCC